MASKTRLSLQTQKDVLFPDNNNQEISAGDLRAHIVDLQDSVYIKLTDAMRLAYSESIFYAMGDNCVFGGALYACTAATNGVFDISKWTRLGNNISNFTQLGDAPSSYAGAAGKVVGVNSGETGLEFARNGGWNPNEVVLHEDYLGLIGNTFWLASSTGASFNPATYVPGANTQPAQGVARLRVNSGAAANFGVIAHNFIGGVNNVALIPAVAKKIVGFTRILIRTAPSATSRVRHVVGFATQDGMSFPNAFGGGTNPTAGNNYGFITIEPNSGNTGYRVTLYHGNSSSGSGPISLSSAFPGGFLIDIWYNLTFEYDVTNSLFNVYLNQNAIYSTASLFNNTAGFNFFPLSASRFTNASNVTNHDCLIDFARLEVSYINPVLVPDL